MRSLLMALALGLFWTQAASAQSGSDMDDYAPAAAAWPFPLYSSGEENISGWPKPVASEPFVKKMMIGALDVHREGGKNVDASCLEEQARIKSLLTWQGLFTHCSSLDSYRPPEPLRFADGCPCLEILNYLCFFDVLSTAKVGPDMGPLFRESEPTPPGEGGVHLGFFR